MLSYRVKVIRSAYALAEVATRSRQPFSSKSNFVPPSQKKLEKTDEIHHDTPADVLESAKNDIKCKSAECSDRWFTNKSRRNNPSVPDAAKRKADEYYYRYPRENEDIDRKQHNISVDSNVEKRSSNVIDTKAMEVEASDAWKKAKDAASGAWESAKETAGNVAESIKNAASATKHKTKELYIDSKTVMKDNLAELKDTTKNQYEDKLHSVKETWNDAKNMAKDKLEDIKSTVKEKSSDFGRDDVLNKTESVAQSVKETWNDAKNMAKDKLEDIKSTVEEKSKDVLKNFDTDDTISKNESGAVSRGLDDVSNSFHESYNTTTRNLPRGKPTRGVGYAGAEATRNQKLMDLDPYRAEIPYEGRTLRPEVMNKCGKADKYQKKVKHFWNR